MRKSFISLLLIFSLIFACMLTACNKPSEINPHADVTINEEIVNKIVDRGFLVVGCKTDVPGLSYFDVDTGIWSGLEIELAYEIAAKIFDTDVKGAKSDSRVQFVGVTVADREDALRNGDIDIMLATYTITDERKAEFLLSDAYYTDYIGLMVRDYDYDIDSLADQGIRSIGDLDGKLIGVPRNATTREAFIEYVSTMTTVTVSPIFCEYDSYEALYNALQNGDIDVMSVDVSILQGYVDTSTVILPDRFSAQHYGAAVLPENSLLMDIVNEVI